MYDIKDIIESLIEKENMKIEDIPGIYLYMDQVLSLFSEYFPYNHGEQELTKTMINNYAKGGIIQPAYKKKYNREHILMILVTCMLKRELSLSEIKMLVDESVENGEEISDGPENRLEVEEIYRRFLDKKSKVDKIAKGHIEDIIDVLKDEESSNRMLDVMTLCYCSNILSEAARAIIRGENDD